MAISVGGINLAEAIINLEYELNRTQRILDWAIQNNRLKMPSVEDVKQMENAAIDDIIKKYPQAGISKKS